jgi:hypothetical protein
MLPRQYLYDRDAFDVMAGAELYWMRFFAALRMTAGFAWRAHERRRSKITKTYRGLGRRGAKGGIRQGDNISLLFRLGVCVIPLELDSNSREKSG